MACARLLSCLVCLIVAAPAFAQQQPSPPGETAPTTSSTRQSILDVFNHKSQRLECEGNHCQLTGQAELGPPGKPPTFFADHIDYYADKNLLVASGNVVFASPEGRIAAERVEFDLAADTGTFHQASGLMSLGAAADRTQFGDQDPDVYFWGETIEKLTAEKYRITRGGFTTCVQPTPRWEVVTGSLVLNLNDYAIARNTVLRVKGVPLMYLPLIYYPIREDKRATGFLLPTYGNSTLRGQAISNAFFWAIGRSHDATFFHDWFTRAGQGAGGEYRYIAGPQSYGNFRFYRFSQDETTYTTDGVASVLPANTIREFTGNAIHQVAPGVRARARFDYFTDVTSQQLYHQNIYQASRSNRVIEGGLSAALGPVATSALYQRNQAFSSATTSQVYGSTPRVTANLAPQRLFNGPVYASMNADYGFLPYQSISDHVVTRDDSLTRVDAMPTIRVPLSKLTYLSVNSSAAYRTTFYSRSFDPITQTTLSDSFMRNYVSLRSDIVGPVFTRIWDLPESGFAERMKHVIEPAVSVDFTSMIDDYQKTPVLSDPSDVVVGGTTRITYGLTNRFFFRGRPVNGARGQIREFVTVGLQQTYYSNPAASQYDSSYRSAQVGGKLVELSPIALTARVSPAAAMDASARLEYDVSGRGLQAVTIGNGIMLGNGSANLNYSHFRRDKSSESSDYISMSATTRGRQGRMAATYALSWDIGRGYVQSQSVIGSYMAQCCGLQMEFQRYNYAAASGAPVPSDMRWNFGFVLAGLGTFSNFFGAFGGQQR